GTRLYAANSNETVAVIDTSTTSIISTISLSGGADGITAMATNGTGNRLYVANHISNSVTVIDTTSNSVISVVFIAGIQGRNVNGIAVTPDDAHVYVTKSQTGDTLSEMDTATNTLSAASVQGGGSGPSWIAIEKPTPAYHICPLY